MGVARGDLGRAGDGHVAAVGRDLDVDPGDRAAQGVGEEDRGRVVPCWAIVMSQGPLTRVGSLNSAQGVAEPVEQEDRPGLGGGRRAVGAGEVADDDEPVGEHPERRAQAGPRRRPGEEGRLAARCHPDDAGAGPLEVAGPLKFETRMSPGLSGPSLTKFARDERDAIRVQVARRGLVEAEPGGSPAGSRAAATTSGGNRDGCSGHGPRPSHAAFDPDALINARDSSPSQAGRDIRRLVMFPRWLMVISERVMGDGDVIARKESLSQRRL